MPADYRVTDTANSFRTIDIQDTGAAGIPMSQDDFFAVVALLQTRGVLSATANLTFSYQPPFGTISPPA